MTWPKIIWCGMTEGERAVIAAWFSDKSVSVEPLIGALRAFATAATKAGLPGTGVAEAPENAPSREDGAAPVPPDPARICAVDDEC